MEISVDTALRFITPVGLFYLGSMMGVLNNTLKDLKKYINYVNNKLDLHIAEHVKT
ncbi:MAG: hypothetical protein KAS66_13265 [Candidatus Omnitrophica bacterium]|nr:hypothetical protein [Candidatus Omnitrophota bacterium]